MGLQIERIYDELRRRERGELEKRIAQVYRSIPEMEGIPAKRRDVVRDAAARRISALQAAEILEELDRREKQLLEANGFPEDMMVLHYSCCRCRDTGWIGTVERRPCACRLKLIAELDSSVGINSRETFENFSTDIFPSDEQARRAVNARNWCEQYADGIPNPEKQNILLTGMSGLGKSYLCNAIAYRVISRGIEARKVTAYAFVQDVLESIRNRTGGIPEIYLCVPLLVIDDLGSESLIQNISEEALFSVLNERANRKKPTVVATNLSVSGLQDRYGERVMSRLVDTHTTQPILLTGDNLRWGTAKC